MKKLLALLLLSLPSVGFCDTKISNLPATTTLSTTDIIPVITTPGGTPANKVITFQNFQNSMVSSITANSLGAIQNTSTLQAGTTFYVSSGTVNGQLTVNGPMTNLNSTTLNLGTTLLLQNSDNTSPTTINNPGGSGIGQSKLVISAGNGVGINANPVSNVDLYTSSVSFSSMTVRSIGNVSGKLIVTDSGNTASSHRAIDVSATQSGTSNFTTGVYSACNAVDGFNNSCSSFYSLAKSSVGATAVGVNGNANGNGTSYGFFSDAFGTGTNYGLYTTALNGTSNYSLYTDQGLAYINGGPGLNAQFGISGGSLTARNLSNTLVAVDANGVLISTTVTGSGTNLLPSTNTWTGSNTFQSSVTVAGSGNGVISLTISGSTYTATSSSSSNTVGHLAVWSSTNNTLMDGGVPGSGGGGSGSGTIGVTPQYQVPFMASVSSNVLTSSANFTNNGSTISMNGIQTIVQSNVSSEMAAGVLFNYATSSMTISSMSVSSLTSGNCVQAGAGGLLTTTAGACGSGGSGASLSSTNTWTAGQTYISSVTISSMTNITNNSGAQGSLAGALNVTTTNSAWNEPGIYVQSTGNMSNNNSDILVDDPFTPAITIRETSQSNPSAKKWQYSAHNGVLRSENRAGDDSGFLPFMQVSSQTFWNDIYFGPTYGNQSNFSQIGVQVSTGNVYALTLTTTTGNVAPYLMTVSSAGVLATNGISVSLNMGIVTTTSTLSNTSTVIQASAPANTPWITLTLPSAASNPGLDLMIYKVDATTGEVRIQGAGSDLIEGTGTLHLDARFQHASLHSLGAVGWGSGLGGIQYTPSRIRAIQQMNNGFSVGTSSTQVMCAIDIPAPVAVTGFAYYQGASANMAFGLLDGNGNVVVSTGPIAGTSGTKATTTTPVMIAPGRYYISVLVSATTGGIMDGAQTNNSPATPGCGAVIEAGASTIQAVTIPLSSQVNLVPSIHLLVNGGETTFQ